jgi:hypothetical protein
MPICNWRYRKLARAICLAPVIFAAGCTSQDNEWGVYWKIMRQSVNGAFRDSGVTRDQAAAIPYASIGYRIDGSREGILVLATDTNGALLWTASSHVVLVTRGGRIVRSVGLPHDIGALAPKNLAELPALSDALKASYHSSRTVDLPDMNRYGVTLDCVTASRGPQSITIIGTAIATVKIEESCRSPETGWSFTDSYWLDASTGFVWHSVQHLHPASTVQTEIFRPPG